ncbi:5-oxoprolinase subunit B/C family protein [Streptacidiphilus fuscans]|nr:urea amidolyase family protein [Streptacidiphilus fuscans]
MGLRALLAEVDSDEHVAALLADLTEHRQAGGLDAGAELVPAARTVLVDGLADAGQVRTLARWLGGWQPHALPVGEGPLVEIPTVYDGEDLADVAALWDVSVEEAARLHAACEFRVAFCGFAPGFAYLTGLPERLAVPRRATPRTRVPAGSVALGGAYTGVYPGPSPGGWQLIGRTSLPLWDPSRDPAALLAPGTRVGFRPVRAGSAAAGPAPGPAVGAVGAVPAATGQSAARAVTVVRPGPLATVQDEGRSGVAALGVPHAGALDRPAAARANALVGNPPGAAVVEATLGGIALRAETDAWVAVTGAPAPVRVGGRTAAWGAAVRARAGELVEVGTVTAGLRCYVAVDGGFAVAPVLGSRSTDLLSGLGPEPLVAGAVLPLGQVGPAVPTGNEDALGPPCVDWLPLSAPSDRDEVVLRLAPGPRQDWFDAEALRALARGRYRVSPQSNRVGLRLTDGPALVRRAGLGHGQAELPSEGMVLGAVQVPPDGMPVVFLADHPTTGGYPVIGVVPEADLAAAAQAVPGTPVRFVPVSGPLR